MDTKEKVVKENNKKVIFRIVAVLVILILIIAMGVGFEPIVSLITAVAYGIF